MEDWLSPLNRVKWMRAFREKDAQVVLTDERKFDITYSKRRFYGEVRDVAFVSPNDGSFVPCGYFSLERVLDKTWLTEGETEAAPPGLYERLLDTFIDSNLNGVNVVEEYKDLQGRTYQTIRRGFMQAKAMHGKKSDHVKVITDNDMVFLVKS